MVKEKGNDIYIVTWNLKTLKKSGALRQLKDELPKYTIMIAAVQETR